MAELDDVDPLMESALMVSLVKEARGLTEWDVVLLMAMDDDEVRCRVEELRTGRVTGELSCH